MQRKDLHRGSKICPKLLWIYNRTSSYPTFANMSQGIVRTRSQSSRRVGPYKHGRMSDAMDVLIVLWYGRTVVTRKICSHVWLLSSYQRLHVRHQLSTMARWWDRVSSMSAIINDRNPFMWQIHTIAESEMSQPRLRTCVPGAHYSYDHCSFYLRHGSFAVSKSITGSPDIECARTGLDDLHGQNFCFHSCDQDIWDFLTTVYEGTMLGNRLWGEYIVSLDHSVHARWKASCSTSL